ncbi:hypothetical protein ACA910_022289 [Epithemia clementina (nom. ined.)]
MKALGFSPERQEWEESYPRMECGISDLTATEPSSLFLRSNETYLDATEKALLHGSFVLPQLLMPETALHLRNYVLKRNRELRESDKVDVIMNDQRTSFTLSPTEHKSVANALQEIGRNRLFVDTMEALLGQDPALMEFQVITAEEGAEPQYFHTDTPPRLSASMNHHTFTPLYTVLIPLQDTTLEMGPTAVCPGSHRCFFTPSCYGFGSDHGENTTEQTGFEIVDVDTGKIEVGSGLIYSSTTLHRGTRHSRGPHRAVLILSFAGRPDHINRPSLYSRYPPLDSVYGIRWHQMGYTLSDLADPYNQMSPSLTRWTGLADTAKLAWTSFRFDLLRAANPDQYGFRTEDLQKQKDQMKGIMGTLSTVFFVDVLPPPRKSEYNDTEYHARRLLERIRAVCFAALAALLVLYLCLVCVANNSLLPGTLVRLTIMVAVIHGCVQFTRSKIDQSTWASDIVAGSIAAGPPESKHRDAAVSPLYSKNLPTPRIQDVLVDSLPLKLAAHAYILDYLPGNRRWRSLALAQSKFYLLYIGMPAAFREAVVENVITLTKFNGSRIFYEKNMLGDFVEMPHERVRSKTRELLLEQVLSPNRRLGHIKENLHCKEGGLRTLCQLRPQLVRDLFQDENDNSNRATISNLSLDTSLIRKRALYIPLQSAQVCVPREPRPLANWEVGDTVQVQMKRSGTYPSRKWVNAEIVKVWQNGSYDLKSYNVDLEQAFGLESSLLRSPQKLEPDLWTLPLISLATKSGHASMAKCKLAAFDLVGEGGCDRSSLSLDGLNPEMARAYKVPADTIRVQIVFDFIEVASHSGDVFVRLKNSDLDLGHFDPKKKDYKESGYFDDVYASVEVSDATKNTVVLIATDRWIVDNELVFGVRVSGGIGIQIGSNVMVTAILGTGRVEAVYEWAPVSS